MTRPPEAVLSDYAAAVRAKDVAAFMALYDNSARVFDLWERWSYEGAASREPAITEWFGSLGEATVDVTFEAVTLVPGEVLSAISAFTTYAAIAPGGEKLRSMQNRLTWLLAKHEGQWRISHEHSSAPINPETLQALLQK